MKKKYIIGGIVAAVLVLIIVGLSFFRKYKDSGGIKIGSISVKVTGDIWKILTGDLEITVTVEIQNFSKSRFRVDQLMIDALTVKNNPVASQTAPLKEAVFIEPNQNSPIETKFKIGYNNIKDLFVDSGFTKVSDGKTIVTNYLKNKKFGVQLKIKGTCTAEGIQIPIEQITEI